MKNTIIAFFLLLTSIAQAQDFDSYLLFANNTDLTFNFEYRVSGNESMVKTGVDIYYPWEHAHYHDLGGNRIITTILDIFLGIDIGKAEDAYLAKCNRFALFGDDDYEIEIDVKHAEELLFTIQYIFTDRDFSFTNPARYNIIYPDGAKDTEIGYNQLAEPGNAPHLANRTISINSNEYKLVYGSFDGQIDPTNNIIFSIGEVNPTAANFDPPAEEVEDPNILNTLTYNIGLLKPVGSNDQEERERLQVIHEVIPKNMDIIIWQEMFEKPELRRIYYSLEMYYPYRSSFFHNEEAIPNLTKDGGVFIMSKHPILEEQDFSYINEGNIIPAGGDDALGDKGVKYVKVNKHGQIIHVFGTHTDGKAIENDVMGAWMKTIAPPNPNEITIMGGDMNTDYQTAQYYRMVDSLGALEPTYNTWADTILQNRGTIWGFNHFSAGRDYVGRIIDYLFCSEFFKFPTVYFNETMAYRYNGINKIAWGIFDMGDHQPVYMRLEFPSGNLQVADTVLCPGDKFSASASTSLTDYSVQWFKDDTVAIVGATSLDFEIESISEEDYGSYTCEIYYTYFPDTAINGIAHEDSISAGLDSLESYEFAYSTCFIDSTQTLDSACFDTIIQILANEDSFEVVFECWDTLTNTVDPVCFDSNYAAVIADTFRTYYAPAVKTGKQVFKTKIVPDNDVCPRVINSVADLASIHVQLFPNPAKAQVTLRLNEKALNSQLKIFNANGALMYSSNIESELSKTIDIESWQSGSYFIQLEKDGRVFKGAFVKL